MFISFYSLNQRFLTSPSFYDLIVFPAFENPAFSELEVVWGEGFFLLLSLKLFFAWDCQFWPIPHSLAKYNLF